MKEMLELSKLSRDGRRLEKAIDRWALDVNDTFISNEDYVILTAARGVMKRISERMRKAAKPECPDVLDVSVSSKGKS